MLSKKYSIFLLSQFFFYALGAQPLEIWEIQGSGNASPYLFETVSTEGNIVTAKGSSFFFIQCPPERSDGDPLTSDGIMVGAPYSGQVGDIVNVSGQILENEGMTAFGAAFLQVEKTASGAPLPPPVTLGSGLPSESPASVHSLERVEGMLVQFVATACGPSNSQELAPLTANGQRPFREPGIRYPGTAGLPVWDGNPEIFWFKPNGLNAPNNRFINTGATVEATAVMIESDHGFWLALPTVYTLANQSVVRAARPPQANEFTIGNLNCYLLYEWASDYPQRLQKLARYIHELMHLPDIIALQEVGSLAALEGLADAIRQRAPQADYEACLLAGNDEIKLGYLVSRRIAVEAVTQLGADATFHLGGRLHDRPPLLLEAVLPTAPPTPIQVLNVHLRSLIGIEGPTAGFVRNKRHRQAQAVAEMAQNLQQDPNLFIVGDFNAFEFTDGYVDVVNQIAGLPSLGAQFAPVPLVQPALVNLVEQLPQEERYSYIYEGNAEAIDHALASTFREGIALNGMEYVRANADNALAYLANPFLVERTSDHDGFVVYLEALNPVASREAGRLDAGIEWQHAQPLPPGSEIRVRSASAPLLAWELYLPSGQRLWQAPLQGSEAVLRLPAALPASGWYVVTVRSAAGSASRVVVQQQ
jgi:endonuclease/exonuclease/phosphatase family metal-dependent hydrolase